MNDFKDSWKDYCTSAWLSMGMPIGLSPRDAIENPEQYDQSYYEYFERRYMDMWMAVYSNVNPVNGNLLKPESPTFRSFWKRYFSWDTIWKQLLPLFVYGTSLGVKNAILIELASYYCLGQAIPSVVIDKMLDDSLTVCSYDFSPFCMSAYGKAISGIRSLDISCGSEIENAYIAYTCEMYDRMLMENNQRFGPFPEHVSDSIRNYFDQKSSRLLSSIFFGVLLEWACLLSEKVRPNELSDSSKKLRQVRQLNDEILDVYSDIRTGLLTLPWLYAIEEFPELQSSIQQLWREKGNTASFGQCQDMMRRSQARQRAAERSRELLGQSMTRTQQLFKAEIAFDITLLHNIRWALLQWLDRPTAKYERDTRTINSPKSPQETLLDRDHSVEPVPGGGVLVVNPKGRVLMTLVAKRNMLRWELPAGVAKNGESLEETAQREAWEETGLCITIREIVAICWHHSRELNKGWMGAIYRGDLPSTKSTDDFMVIADNAFAKGKFNFKLTPNFYNTWKLEKVDFDAIQRKCDSRSLSTVHESVIAAGFVDWKKIPPERMHPQHRKLLENWKDGPQFIAFLIADADKDRDFYEPSARLYYSF